MNFLGLIASDQNLKFMESLYSNIYVPREVVNEIIEGGKSGFGIEHFKSCNFFTKEKQQVELIPHLKNSLDQGEASAIQLALTREIETVCIDEPAGRRIARLYNLDVTGSLGILLKAISQGYDISIREAINNMQNKGIYISENLADKVIKKADKFNNR